MITDVELVAKLFGWRPAVWYFDSFDMLRAGKLRTGPSTCSGQAGATLRLIQFKGVDGKRRSIRLGKLPLKSAEDTREKISLLERYSQSGQEPDGKMQKWLMARPNDVHKTLSDGGLVEPRKPQEPVAKPKAILLGEFLDGYVEKRSDVKDGTATVYGHTRRCLVDYFGADKSVEAITPDDADDWRRWLAKPKNENDATTGGQGLAENTVRRRCGIAKEFVRSAVRGRLIAENPFGDMKGLTVGANEARDSFVTRDVAEKVIAACPDAEWKLLFALSRYGGLRWPSEHLALRWGDVQWDTSKIIIRSPKTAHHEAKGVRVMPLFPELRSHLETAWNDLLDSGFDPKVSKASEQPVVRRYRDSNSNLRTQLCRIIAKAGLTPWPKLFQDLRASRATELAGEYPGHVAAAWMGHSEKIASEHYWRPTDADFERAVQNPVQTPTAGEPKSSEAKRNEANENKEGRKQSDDSRDASPDCVPILFTASETVSPAGLELSPDSSGETTTADTSAAFLRAVQDPGLEAIVAAWPTLPLDARAEIVRMVKASKPV
jgi:integrase